MAKTKSTPSTPSTPRPRRAASKRATGSTAANPGTQISEEDRQRMIAEAAYYRAQARGFNGGDAIDDWLAAEREINRLLPSPQQQKKEMAAYQALRADVTRLLGDMKDASADTIRGALDTGRTRLRQLEEYTADNVEKAVTSVEKEMFATARRLGAQFENLSERTTDLFAVWRDRGSQFLGRATGAVSEWMQGAGTRASQQIYRTGDIAATGTLECTQCSERVVLETPAHVPLCPKCRQSEFRRVD